MAPLVTWNRSDAGSARSSVSVRDWDSAISAAVHGGDYVRVLSIEAAQQSLQDCCAQFSTIGTMLRSHRGSRTVLDASEEALAFRAFRASIFPSDVTANYQHAGLDTVATTAARHQRVAGQSASRLRTATVTPDAAAGVSLAADKSRRIHRNDSAASRKDF